YPGLAQAYPAEYCLIANYSAHAGKNTFRLNCHILSRSVASWRAKRQRTVVPSCTIALHEGTLNASHTKRCGPGATERPRVCFSRKLAQGSGENPPTFGGHPGGHPSAGAPCGRTACRSR